MKDLKKLDGKKLAIITWKLGQENKNSIAVFTGIARVVESGLTFEYPGIEPLKLKKVWLRRIEKVPTSMRERLKDADYLISLSVGDSDEDPDIRDFEKTGLKWPE